MVWKECCDSPNSCPWELPAKTERVNMTAAVWQDERLVSTERQADPLSRSRSCVREEAVALHQVKATDCKEKAGYSSDKESMSCSWSFSTMLYGNHAALMSEQSRKWICEGYQAHQYSLANGAISWVQTTLWYHHAQRGGATYNYFLSVRRRHWAVHAGKELQRQSM